MHMKLMYSLSQLSRITVIGVAAVTQLMGCEGQFQSADKRTLEWFKTTTGSGLSSIIGGAEIQRCPGVSGRVDWKIFTGEGKAPNLRIIEANVSNKGKKATFQWTVNPDNKAFELSYAVIDGEAQAPIFLGLGLMSICSL